MAQSGFTPILLYASGTPTNTPSAGNLTSSAAGAELALNYADGKLFYKDSGGVVQTLASKATGSIGGSTTQVQYNNAGALAGSANLTFDGTALTLGGNPTLSAGTANGVLYLNGSKVATSGSALTFDGNTLASIRSTAGLSASFGSGSVKNDFSVTHAGNGEAIWNAYPVASPSTAAAMAWQLGGTEQMRLNSTGLGIGTNNPGQRLDVVGTVRSTTALGTAPRLALFQTGAGDYSLSIPASTNALAFNNAGSEIARFDSSGNLGIGTSSPGYKLSVNGDAAVLGQNTLRLQNSDNTNAYALQNAGATGSGNAYLSFVQSGVAERMRLDASGNLGIGTSSPSTAFQVVRNYTGGLAASLPNIIASNTAPSASPYALAIVGAYTLNETLKVELIADGSGIITNSAGGGLFTRTNHPLVFGTNSTERMRLDSSGNLGLGVTPSAWGIFKGMQFPGGALVGNAGGVGNNQVALYNNAYFDGANERYLTSDTAQQFRSIAGAFQWRQALGGTAGNTISFTQAMTLDASGNLLLNTTATATAKQVIQTGTGNGLDFFRSDTNANFGAIRFRDTTNANTNAQIGWNANELRLDGTNIVSLVTGGNERARITSGGDLAVGTTGAINNNVVSAYASSKNAFVAQVTNNANSNFQGFNSSGVATFQVLGSGVAQLLSGAAGTLNYLDVGRTAGETRIGVAASINDFLSGTAIGDSVFYKVNAGNAWYGTAGSGAAVFATNNQERARITAAGNVVAGGSIALATNATDGFLYVPTCGGTPTGTPTAITGMAPIVVNTTNNKLYFYSGGAWRDAGP